MTSTITKILLTTLSISALAFQANAQTTIIKKSSSGICHDTNSPSYNRTKNFDPYISMEQCISSGGKSYSGFGSSAEEESPKISDIPKYDRKMYRHWLDADKNCLDSREEALLSQSVSIQSNGNEKVCTITKGIFNDPYSGKRFYNASDLDADHIVALEFAHYHGAYAFDDKMKAELANDPINILVVEASLNRSKGSKSPIDWLPPNPKFQCQYILRFERVMKKYGLTFSETEKTQFSQVKEERCN